jgi:glycosyltransferase involved in cell wall biosynthesis
VKSNQRTSTLFLTRNGLLEPLGQSQILSYLRGLSRDFDITVISYEKSQDWADSDRVSTLKAECQSLGIRWLPLRFLSGPKLLAPKMAILQMIWMSMREARRSSIRLIHARSYVPAMVCLVVKRVAGVPFIFDMRALWPEELITAGRIRRGSLLHRLLTSAERACLHQASAVVCLTHAAAEYLQTIYPDQLQKQRIVIIPTCVDLGKFTPNPAARKDRVVGCLGTLLSGWFRIDWLAKFMSVGLDRDSEIHLQVTTRDDPKQVRLRLGEDPRFNQRFSVDSSTPEAVPLVLQQQTCSVMFYAGGEVSELGRSPTRMAEILACGLPVIANEGVGDVADIIRNHNVGVLVEGASDEQLHSAWNQLDQLLQDPTLGSRCRATAESLFSLDAGTEAYRNLYKETLAQVKPGGLQTS